MYPKLKEFYYSNNDDLPPQPIKGLVILFTMPNYGMIVSQGTGCYPVGIINYWDESTFKDYNGTVFLGNVNGTAIGTLDG